MTSFPDSRISDELRDQAIEWAIRCLDGGSEEERRALAAWLEEDPAHRAASAEIAARYRPSRHRRRAQRWVGLALAAALVLALGLTAFSPDGWYGSRDRYVAARGDFQTVDLADGSRLELNTDSEVEVRLNRWQRSVTLVRGEAYFRVAHDAERPFVVIAGNGRSVDIGTEFDVYMRPDRVLVAVHEGRVRVDARQSRELGPSETLAYNRDGEFVPVASNESVDTVTAWRRGKLVFNNRRLDEVLAEIGRYHDIRLRLSDPSLGRLKVSGTFFINRLDTSLEIIADSLGVALTRPRPGEVVLGKR